MTAPYEARHLSGFKVEVKWKAPISTAGLMNRFVLRAYNNKDPLIDPVEALITNTSKRIGKLFYGELIHLKILLPFFTRETTFVTFCLLSCTPIPF